MVDTPDLKSVDSNGREGSSPSTPMQDKRVEGTLTRVDPFYLPMFLYENAVNDIQSEALVKMCAEQEYHPSILPEYGEEEAKLSTGISVDKKVLHSIPDMKKHFELLIQDISFQVLRQNSEGFEIKSSWTTKTEKGQSSRMHLHKNYYFSAILYLQEDNNLVLKCPWWDKGSFLFPVYQQSPYTCDSTLVSAPKNSLLILPSWVMHEIPKWQKDEIRYSIAMNIHPVGEYGVSTSWIEVK